jgi:signal transduction histidine kinase
VLIDIRKAVQVDISIAKNYGGFGLGLSIVRDLVRAHNGAVTVQSTLNIGSTFTFTLPAADPEKLLRNGSRKGQKRQASRPDRSTV